MSDPSDPRVVILSNPKENPVEIAPVTQTSLDLIASLTTRLDALKLRLQNDTTFVEATVVDAIQDIADALAALTVTQQANDDFAFIIETRIQEMEDFIESKKDVFDATISPEILSSESSRIRNNLYSELVKRHSSFENEADKSAVVTTEDINSVEQDFIRLNPSVWSQPYAIQLNYRKPMTSLKLFDFQAFKAEYRDVTKYGAWIGAFLFEIEIRSSAGYFKGLITSSAFYQNDTLLSSKEFDETDVNAVTRYGAGFNADIVYGDIFTHFDLSVRHSRFEHYGEVVLVPKDSSPANAATIDSQSATNYEYMDFEIIVTPIICRNISLPVVSKEKNETLLGIGSFVTQTTNRIVSNQTGFGPEINPKVVEIYRRIIKSSPIFKNGGRSRTPNAFLGIGISSFSFKISNFSSEVTANLKPLFENKFDKWLDFFGHVVVNGEKIPVESAMYQTKDTGHGTTAERVIFRFHRDYKRRKDFIGNRSFVDLLKYHYVMGRKHIYTEDLTKSQSLKAPNGFIYCLKNVIYSVPFVGAPNPSNPGFDTSYLTQPIEYHRLVTDPGYDVKKIWPFVFENSIRAFYAAYSTTNLDTKLYFLDEKKVATLLMTASGLNNTNILRSRLSILANFRMAFAVMHMTTSISSNKAGLKYYFFDENGKVCHISHSNAFSTYDSDLSDLVTYGNYITPGISRAPVTTDRQNHWTYATDLRKIYLVNYSSDGGYEELYDAGTSVNIVLLENRYDYNNLYFLQDYELFRLNVDTKVLTKLSGQLGVNSETGDGSLAINGTLSNTNTIAGVVGSDNAVYLPKGNGLGIRKIIPGGNISSFTATVPDRIEFIFFNAAGVLTAVTYREIYTFNAAGTAATKIAGDRSASTFIAGNTLVNTRFQFVAGTIAADWHGNIYGEIGSGQIIRLTPGSTGQSVQVSGSSNPVSIVGTLAVAIGAANHPSTTMKTFCDEEGRLTKIAMQNTGWNRQLTIVFDYTTLVWVIRSAIDIAIQPVFTKYIYRWPDPRKDNRLMLGKIFTHEAEGIDSVISLYSNAVHKFSGTKVLVRGNNDIEPLAANSDFSVFGFFGVKPEAGGIFHYRRGSLGVFKFSSIPDYYKIPLNAPSVIWGRLKFHENPTERGSGLWAYDNRANSYAKELMFLDATAYSDIVIDYAACIGDSVLYGFTKTSDSSYKLVMTRGNNEFKPLAAVDQNEIISFAAKPSKISFTTVQDAVSRFFLVEYFTPGNVKKLLYIDHLGVSVDIPTSYFLTLDASFDTLETTGIYCGFIPQTDVPSATVYPGVVVSNELVTEIIDNDSYFNAGRSRLDIVKPLNPLATKLTDIMTTSSKMGTKMMFSSVEGILLLN